MATRNQPSEGIRKKGTVLPAALAFLGIMGYGPVASQINSGLKADARSQAKEKISQSRDRLHVALGHFSLKNNPGINRAKGKTVQSLTLDNKACELIVDEDGRYFIFAEGEERPYFLGEKEKAFRMLSALKNIFGSRQGVKTVLAVNNQ
ncbi:hypothetical protein KKA33_01920 [Patescibacteria group bacterium]|nr:hypothetical protein [Patescibacteria group bacterium]